MKIRDERERVSRQHGLEVWDIGADQIHAEWEIVHGWIVASVLVTPGCRTTRFGARQGGRTLHGRALRRT